MKDKERWEALGSQLKDIVEDAVSSNNFEELNKNITEIVNSSLDEVRTQIKNTTKEFTTNNTKKTAATRHSAANYGYNPSNSAGFNSQTVRNFTNIVKTPRQAALIRKPKGKGSAFIQEIFGYCTGGALIGSSLFSLNIAALQTVSAGSLIGAACFGVAGAACIALGFMGTKKRGQLDRFHRYIKTMGNELYYDVEDFARKLGYSQKVILKDLKEMIRTGIFKEGHLDKQETCLMITDKMYDQYLETQQNYEEQQRDKAAADSYNAAANAASNAKMNAECKAVLDEGEEYIRHINYCSRQIKDSEMRSKLDRLSLVITRIFAEIKKDPDKVSDIRRMMSFYLPTTRKLIQAYCELENQPVAGENIEGTKKEIEKSLDTLNQAFEKLLDDLFQDTAWDISSDISVLNTMLAQDGYTNDKIKTN